MYVSLSVCLSVITGVLCYQGGAAQFITALSVLYVCLPVCLSVCLSILVSYASREGQLSSSLPYLYTMYVCLSLQVSYAIREGQLSSSLPCERTCVYMNITTLEDRRFCIRLSMRGFEVCLLHVCLSVTCI